MNEIIKQVIKLVLPMLATWLVKKAEKKFIEAKAGKDKKAYVINTISDFMESNNLELDSEKVSKLIDDKVSKLINSSN